MEQFDKAATKPNSREIGRLFAYSATACDGHYQQSVSAFAEGQEPGPPEPLDESSYVTVRGEAIDNNQYLTRPGCRELAIYAEAA